MAITTAKRRLDRVIFMNVFLPETPVLMAQNRCVCHSLNKLSLEPAVSSLRLLVAKNCFRYSLTICA